MGLGLILPIVGSIADLATEIFKGKNDKNKKKYAERAARLKLLIGNETAKPMEEWIHSDIEAWIRELDAIGALALAEVKAYENK